MILATIFITIEISGLALMWWAILGAQDDPDERPYARIIPFPQRDFVGERRRRAGR